MIRSTTILAVRHRDKVVIAGDGQVSMEATVIKHNACKVRRLYHGKVLTGFAGAAADAIALYEKFEAKLEQYNGNLERAAVELAKEWRTDKILRQLEALLLVSDKVKTLLISGTGDVIEPDDGVIGIGSGGGFAEAAARAFIQASDLDAKAIAEAAMHIAAGICIYTNSSIAVEEIE